MSSEPQESGFLGDDWLVLALAAPSGAGKTTLKNRLVVDFPDLRFSISHTTRAPRAHEQDGREYHFTDRTSFERLLREGAFFEHAEVFGNLYGTSLREIDEARQTRRGIVLDLDIQGVRQLVARQPGAVTVFVLPPSLAELERRLRGRGDEPAASVERRLKEAGHEVEHYALFDYLIVNDELDRAYGELRSIVLAERSRRGRRALVAERFLRDSAARRG
jgi:guanylate kinase